jgi:hypothetical protein
MALYGSPRRYYHRKRMNARAEGNGELEGLWRYKQEHCLPATPLPLAPLPALPYVALLSAAGYDVLEDLIGADVDELVQVALLRPSEATEVVAALARALLSVA